MNKSTLDAWVKIDKIRPVEVTSSLPPGECVRRLAQVTTARKTGWYLDARTATLPDPLFHGTVDSSRVRIVQFRDVIGRGSGSPVWFDVRVDPGPDGGTVLAGTVGSRTASAEAVSSLVVMAVFAALGLVSFVVGVVIAASGHFNLGVGAAIGIPVLVAASVAIGASRGDLTLERNEARVPPLLRTICGVLDATSVTSD